MAAGGKEAYDGCMRWIGDETRIHETAPFGSNKRSVTEQNQDQGQRVRIIKQYKGEVDKAAKNAQDAETSSKLRTAYTDLQAVADHRQSCLQTVGQISSLEDSLNNLSVEFAQRASTLVSHASLLSPPPTDGGEGGEHMARAAHECILSVRNNWQWISKLLRCSENHLQNVSDYHQFFHEAEEYEGWMGSELARQLKAVEDVDPNTSDSQKFILVIKTALSTFLSWQHKIVDLFDRSRKILPVHLRTNKLDMFRPVKALCDYQTREITIRDTEDLTLLDNSDHHLWKVRNIHGHEAQVPSVIFLLPGVANEAIALGNRLRLKLLTLWTVCVKIVGQKVISRLLYLIKEWSSEERGKLQAFTQQEKDAILQLLPLIHQVFGRSWEGYQDFVTLCKREGLTKEAFDGASGKRDTMFTNLFLSDMADVKTILTAFQEFWSFWETFKILTESTEHRDMMLLPEKWEEWGYFSTTEILRKLNIGIEINEQSEERIEETKVETQEAVKEEEVIEDEWHTEEEVVTDTQEISHASQEEKKTFVITGVIDPRSQEEVSMQQAVMLGIIDQTRGLYVNRKSGLQIPIPQAMNEGLIKVEFSTTQKSAETRKDIGLITVRTQKETRPYTVKSVRDAETEEDLTVDEALERKLLDNQGRYYHGLSKEYMSLSEALESGLLKVEFDKDAPVNKEETKIVTYAIYGVVDQRDSSKISFAQAVAAGILNKDTGNYYHSKESRNINVVDAIKTGFIKAKVVTDPNSLDIAPENKMVVEKVKNIKGKLKALSAFRGTLSNSTEEANGQNGASISSLDEELM